MSLRSRHHVQVMAEKLRKLDNLREIRSELVGLEKSRDCSVQVSVSGRYRTVFDRLEREVGPTAKIVVEAILRDLEVRIDLLEIRLRELGIDPAPETSVEHVPCEPSSTDT